MTIYGDVQSLEPGARIELFELDARPITGGGAGDILRFHGYTQVGPIWWQGLEYTAWPIEAEGFVLDPSRPAHPTLTVGNLDRSITIMCAAYQDLVGAKISRHRTLGKYLDAVNFSAGNSTADPTQEFPAELWFIEQKTAETAETVQFEISSALDFQGIELPRRKIIANLCYWKYRGAECGYTGSTYFDENDSPVSTAEEDVCSHRLSGCKARFGVANELPYGGFPAARLTG